MATKTEQAKSPSKIYAAEQPLQKLFSEAFDFSIPLYQRPYAWTTKEASELIEDLIDNMGSAPQPVDETNPYFLGSVVLVKGDDPRSDVVDGQQRLTTITILLSALRASLPKDEGDGITDFLYEKANPIKGTQNRYRLTLRKQDSEFFREYVQKSDGLDKLNNLNGAALTDPQRNIRDNTSLFVTRLASLKPEQRSRLAQFIARRCFLVAVSTPDFSSAYRIFSVLNSRGLDLTHSDILKSEMIGEITARKQPEYTEKWEDTENALGRDGFQELFAHIRMIYRKTKLGESVLDEYKKHILPGKNKAEFIDDVILPYADAYQIARTASYQSTSDADPVNELLRWLNKIDNFDWIPPAILFLSKNGSTTSSLVTFFNSLERLAAGQMILRRNVNERITRYARLMTLIESGKNLYTPDSPLELSDTEKKEILAVLGGDLYLQSKTRVYVLLRLDSALSKGQAVYNYPVITVEHVLPQTPEAGSKWLTWFPDETLRAQGTHRLGNLALLSRKKNSSAQNFEFDKKKAKYFSDSNGVSNFALTTQVLAESEWTPDIVEKRQKQLIGVLKKVWSLN